MNDSFTLDGRIEGKGFFMESESFPMRKFIVAPIYDF